MGYRAKKILPVWKNKSGDKVGLFKKIFDNLYNIDLIMK